METYGDVPKLRLSRWCVMATIPEALRQGWTDYQAGSFARAEQVSRQIVQADPRSVDAWFLLGAACQAQGKLDDAIAGYRRAALLRPDFAEIHYRLGNALYARGLLGEALTSYQQALLLRPQHAETHNNLGVVLADQGRPAEAVPYYQQALALKSTYAEAHYNLGNAFKALQRLDEAVASYQHAIRHNPQFAPAYLNLGVALTAQGKPAEAVAAYRQAIQREPDMVQAHNNMGLALAHQNQLDEALACYARALQIQPDFADAHYNRALALLVRGDFAQGWPEYEWRWRLAEIPSRPFTQPRWDGSPLAGRTILLHAEQGAGDTIQFIRYAPLVQQRGGRVLLECPAALIPLLSTCRGIDQLIGRGTPLPAFDVHAPLLSLPGIFRTSLATIPADIPYLATDPQQVERWRHQLEGIREFKIGISWQGSPGYRWDRQRSFALAHLEPVARLIGVRLFSLQKGLGTEQLRDLPGWFPVTDLGGTLDENTGAFVETAAVLKNLDLVITCDTALGHLAGALGVPVWIVLPFAPEWRWLLDRDDSPWYPTVRLFRQERLGDWDGVFARVAAELRRRLGTTGRARPVVVEIAPGELLDKITILEIKSERITDEAKLTNIRRELALLTEARGKALEESDQVTALVVELKAVNEALWQIEDEIRDCERAGDFGPRFIELARSVYRQNDRRSALKRRINELLGSGIVEEK